MKVNVSREYRWWVACNGDPNVTYDNECLDHPFEVVNDAERKGEAGYQLRDFQRVIHVFVPAEFCTVVE